MLDFSEQSVLRQRTDAIRELYLWPWLE
jgi:hypothetical protein